VLQCACLQLGAHRDDGKVLVNARYEVDVKRQITMDGRFSVALESPSTNGADYRSREGCTTTAPQLVIVVR